jgi:Fe-S-cluster containining protein
MKAISELHQQIDRLHIRLMHATAEKGKPVTCPGKGCCACCYEPVYCSSDEVKHMLEMLNDRQKMGVAHQMVESIAIVKKSGLFDIDMPPVMEWKALNLPCPFLVDGQCSVYERRPISCRAHMTVGPPEWCAIRRLEQKYVGSDEVSYACGQMIIAAHLRLGNTITHDNLLALLENELLGEYHETASAQQIVFTETDKKERTENGK